ncbi:histidine kinase [Actinoallomurus sp. NPDC050550]|uniref:histidine kinase n=1 Tax=Actinoallomurus sp. NPDC050550 TaxID=3154937 RepID=UPI0033C36A0C
MSDLPPAAPNGPPGRPPPTVIRPTPPSLTPEIIATMSGPERAESRAGDSARVRQSLTDEHDRIAHDLNDTIVRQMFAVSLHLHIALTRIDDAYATERICHAIGGLDEAIKDLRITIFGFRQSERTPSPYRHQQNSYAVGTMFAGMRTASSSATRTEPKAEVPARGTRSYAWLPSGPENPAIALGHFPNVDNRVPGAKISFLESRIAW